MITKQEIQPVITKKVVITDSLFASYVNAIAAVSYTHLDVYKRQEDDLTVSGKFMFSRFLPEVDGQ